MKRRKVVEHSKLKQGWRDPEIVDGKGPLVDLLRIVRAINHTFRLKILGFLIKNKEEVKVTKIYVLMRCEQSVMSQNLKILREVGIIKGRRWGKVVYYSVDYEGYKAINRIIKFVYPGSGGLEELISSALKRGDTMRRIVEEKDIEMMFKNIR